jgi:hypothetical protein
VHPGAGAEARVVVEHLAARRAHAQRRRADSCVVEVDAVREVRELAEVAEHVGRQSRVFTPACRSTPAAVNAAVAREVPLHVIVDRYRSRMAWPASLAICRGPLGARRMHGLVGWRSNSVDPV